MKKISKFKPSSLTITEQNDAYLQRKVLEDLSKSIVGLNSFLITQQKSH